MAIFEHNYRVNMNNINQLTYLSNKSFLSFFEDIGGLHSDEAGYGLKNINETKLSWVLLHWKVTILKRPIYGQEVTVKTWARDCFKFFTSRDFEMFDKITGERLAYGTSKWTLIHLDKGLHKMDTQLISKYEPENLRVYEENDLEKLKEPTEFSNVFEYTVIRRDIDINKHMHNLYYLDLAYEALPLEVYEKTLSDNFKNIEIMYKKEAKLGTLLKCYYFFDGTNHIVTIKSEENGNYTLHAIVKLN